jgi:anti-sigma factor RsiW
MNCDELRKTIHRRADEILSGTPDREIQDHLNACPECSRLVRRFQRAWLTLETRQPIEPSPHWRTRLRQAIADEKKGRPALGWLGRSERILRPALAVGLVLAGVIAGQLLAGVSGLADGTATQSTDTQTAETTSTVSESFSSYYLEVFNSLPEGSVEDSYLSLASDS